MKKIAPKIFTTSKTLINLALIFSLLFPSFAFADTTISTANVLPQTYSSNGEKLTIASGGNLTVSNTVDLGAAVSGNGNTGLKLQVDASSGQGVASTGGNRGAFELTSTATLGTIVLNTGRITSDKSSGGTIILQGSGGTGSITTASGTTISNTATIGYGIDSTTSTNTTLTITNAGTISTNDNASSIGIKFGDSNGGSSLTLNNSGSLTAGALGTAIQINNSSNTATISNTGSGSITGAITSATSSLSLTNNTSGSISGAISTTSGDLDLINTAGTITGNINLGTNASSTAALNGGTVTGNFTLGNSSQTLTLGGGALAGTIDGAGQVIVNTSSHTLNGNIGASTSITTLTINGSSTLTTTANNNTIRATTVSIANTGTLTLGTGAITGTTQGASDGVGTVNFNGDNTLAGHIGTGSNSLSAITIANSKTVTAGSFNLDALTTSIGSSATLALSTGTVTGIMQGSSDGVGTVTFAQDFTLGGALGTSANSLLSATVAASKTLTAGSNNIDVTTLSLGSSSILTLASGTLTGVVQGASDGVGTVNVTQNLTSNGNIGTSANSLSSVAVSASRTLDLTTNNNNIDATTISLGSSSSMTIGTGTITGTVQGASDGVGNITFNQNHTLASTLGTGSNSLASVTIADTKTLTAGSINIDATTVSVGSGSTLALSTGTVTGIMQGSSDGVGTVTFAQDFTLGGALGTSANSLLSATVAASKTLTAGSNNIDVTTLSLGSSSILTLASGTLTGLVQGASDGVGTVNVTQNLTSNGNIGTSVNSLSAVVVSASRTLDLATNNNNLDATTLTLNSSSILTLGTGAVTGTTQGASDGVGTINFNGDNTLAGHMGTGSNSLSAITIASSKTVNAGSFNLDATTISIGSSSTLALSSGSVTGIMQGSSDGVGAVTFAQDFTLGGVLGTGVNSLSSVSIAASKTLTAGSNNIDATTISVGSSATLALSSGTVTGVIQGASDGVGTTSFAQDFTLGGNLGTSSNSLSAVSIAASRTLTAGSNNIDVTTTSLGSGSILTLASGTVTGTIQGASDGVGTASFTQDFTLGGALGTNANSLDTVSISDSRTLTAGSNNIDATTISVGSGSTLTLAAGTVTGTILGSSDGVGTASFTQNFSLAGNLGTSSNSLSAVSISASRTLTAGSNNIDATTISLASGSTLALSSGTVTGAIQGTSSGVGTVSFAENFSSGGNIGSTNAIATASIASGKTLTLGSNNLIATNITLASSSILNVGSGTLTGTVDGSSTSLGTVNLNSSNTIASGTLLGSSTGLTTINLADGISITGNDSMKASSVNIGSSSAATLSLAASKTITGNVALASGSSLTLANNSAVSGTINGSGTLAIASSASVTTNGNIGNSSTLTAITLASSSTLDASANNNSIAASTISLGSGSTFKIGTGAISGSIDGSASGNGTVQFAGSGAVSNSSALGSNTKISAVTISNGANLSNSATLNADTITIGGGTSGSLTHSSGTLGASSSIIAIDNGATFTFSGGSINGTVRGASANRGTFTVNSDFTPSGAIGSTNDLATLNINSGKTLTAGGNISANSISLAGTLDLGDSARSITGNLSGAGSGTINAGNAYHSITGTFIANAGDSLAVKVSSSTLAGKITTSGTAANSASSNLEVTIDNNSDYISSGSTYTILSGSSGSSINAISSANIDVGNSGSNRSGLLSFTTSKSGNDLLMTVSRDSISTLTQDQNLQRIYTAIDSIGAAATGKMRSLQQYLDASSTTDTQRISALKSVEAEIDNAINKNSFHVTNVVANANSTRLNNLRIGIASGDETANSSIWAQPFGSIIAQDATSTADGYDSNSVGFTIGGDHDIFDNDHLGISTSYISSNIKSTDGMKKTDITTYQINIYEGHNVGNFFLNTILGAAWNKYSSSRVIPAVNAVAHADYNGQTYIAKIEAGIMQNIGRGFTLTPEMMITAARNDVDGYSESGADSLNLEVKNSSTNFFEGRVGLNLSHNSFTKKGSRLRPEFSISYGHDFIGANQTATTTFVGQTNSFQTEGASVPRGSLKVGTGIHLYRTNAVTLSANYEYEHKNNYRSHTGLLRARYNF